MECVDVVLKRGPRYFSVSSQLQAEKPRRRRSSLSVQNKTAAMQLELAEFVK